MTAILGGISTILASYIARVRGSGDPEKSLLRAKDLEQFIREAELFQMDFGFSRGDEHNEMLLSFRTRLEEILGHNDRLLWLLLVGLLMLTCDVNSERMASMFGGRTGSEERGPQGDSKSGNRDSKGT